MADTIEDIFAKRQDEHFEARKKRRRQLLMLLAMAEGGRGQSGGVISLSGTHTLAEDFASGGVVGALSVTGATGTPTYSIDSDPSNKFAIDGTNLETDATLDYETATSHVVTISVSGMTPQPPPKLFTITVTNVVEDSTPSAFSFTDVTGAALSTVYVSNSITVAGTDDPALAVSITGGTYSKNGGAYTSGAGIAGPGDNFTVSNTSSGSYSTAVNAALTIGGVSDTFTITTMADPEGSASGPIGLLFLMMGVRS